MKKVCSKCKTQKDYAEYHKYSRNKDGIQNVCKICNIEYRKHYYKTHPGEKEKTYIQNEVKRKNMQSFFNKVKSENKCCFCSEDNPICLDFHHLFDKLDGVSELINKHSFKKAKLEIQKCVVVCANCHRKIHAGLLDCSNKTPILCPD